MKIKSLILTLLVTVFFQINDSEAKILPPGTGTQADVPSNLLILLDASGSMGWRMSSAQSVDYPMQAATDSSGDIYVAQYYIYGVKKFTYADKKIDTTWGNNGTHKNHRSTNSSSGCRVYYSYGGAKIYNGILYVPSYYDRKIRKIRVSDGKCLGSVNLTQYVRGLDIHNGHLYATYWGGVYTENLSNSSKKYCGNIHSALNYSFGMAANGNYLYAYYNNKIYRYNLVSSGSNICPSSAGVKISNRTLGTYIYGLTAHPSNSGELYALSYNNSKLYKITVNSSGTSNTLNWTKGTRKYNGTSSASALYFYYPLGLHYDDTNDRLIASGYNSRTVEILDNSGTWIKTIGGAATTRMKAAQNAIKAIVTDSNLTSGVNFGFGMWSSGSAGFSSWSGHITTGNAKPCSRYNCLKVRVHKDGAARINQIISSVSAVGGTDADAFMKIAQQYYTNKTYTPVDKNSPCQKSYVIVIGDGDWYNHSRAVAKAKSLYNSHKIPTFAVAFGTGISSSGLRNFNRLAAAGGTQKAIIATTAESLKTQLQSAISQIIASKLSFTAPAITATLNSSGSLYQAQFDYAQNKEWTGTIKRTAINSKGELDTKDKGNWSAIDKLPKPQFRKIWSAIPGTDYENSKYNNFVEGNSTEIDNIFTLMKHEILDYHRTSNNSDGSTNNKRCASTSGVADGTTDDLKGLINFVRGSDYFDYDADCNLTETRSKPMGDVYHSQLVVVGKPEAETAYSSTNEESYWRSTNGYDSWAESLRARKEVIYAGSNSGVLHALDAKSGVELWGFVPPFVASQLPKIMNTNLNQTSPSKKGGSNAIYGVDGSPVQHDIYFKSPHDTSAAWHTVLFVPYGRGGSGFSILDVTDPAKPEHLVSIYNDIVSNVVYRMDYNEDIYTYDYIGTSYALSEFEEAKKAGDNYNADNNVSKTCNDSGTTACYKSKSWTLRVQNLTKKDIEVLEGGTDITGSVTISYDSNNFTVITFGKEMEFDADETVGKTKNNSPIGVNIKQGTVGTGVLSDPEWDYSGLGETWSDPRMMRLPNKGAGDNDRSDDINVAVMGGGFATQFSGAGSSLFIINLQDTDDFGKLEKVINIEDTSTSDITNAVPASVSLITSDLARGADFAGGLVYTSDLEGKITKVNLTNMSSGGGQPIKMYDSTTLFKAGATKTNGRYMYYPMDVAIGKTTNTLWLFSGTGDSQRLNDRSKGVDNLLIGIKDRDYPNYAKVATPLKADDITDCKDTTNDKTGAKCPENKDRGWYIKIKDFAKASSEPTVNNGLVYFPIYRPSKSANKCDLGDAFICAADDECGTHTSYLGLENSKSEQKGNICRFVGKGVLSKIVIFAGKLFANISGKSLGKVTDLVTVDAATGDIQTYRTSWREN